MIAFMPMKLSRRIAARVAPFALAFAITGASSLANAAPVQQELDLAEQAYANLDYPEANKIAERVVKQRGLNHDQLIRGYRVLALTYAVLDKEVPAKDAFVALLTYDPDFQVDANLGPRVQTPFFEARGFWRAQSGKPGIEASTVLRPKEPGTIRITTRDPSHVVKKVNVGFRWGATEEMTVRTVAVGDNVPVEVPPPPPGTTRLDYYTQAVDDRDDAVFEVGNAGSPKSAVVQVDQVRVVQAASGGGGVFSSPVFWIITGVVVAGAATAIGVVALKPDDKVVTHTTYVPATSGALSPILGCGGATCN